MSVGAPFSRSCGSETIEINGSSRRVIKGAKTEDLSALDSIDSIKSISTFNSNFEAISNAARVKLIGTKDDQLKYKFEQLFDRLKKSGQIDPETNRRIKMLIGLAAGDIQNVFNDRDITAIMNH